MKGSMKKSIVTAWKRLFAAMLALMLIMAGLPMDGLSLKVRADGEPEPKYSGECGANGDNIKWEYYEDGTLKILGEGEMEDYYSGSGVYNPNPSYPPWSRNNKDSEYTDMNVKNIFIEDGITSIGNGAFDMLRTDSQIDLVLPAALRISENLPFR